MSQYGNSPRASVPTEGISTTGSPAKGHRHRGGQQPAPLTSRGEGGAERVPPALFYRSLISVSRIHTGVQTRVTGVPALGGPVSKNLKRHYGSAGSFDKHIWMSPKLAATLLPLWKPQHVRSTRVRAGSAEEDPAWPEVPRSTGGRNRASGSGTGQWLWKGDRRVRE